MKLKLPNILQIKSFAALLLSLSCLACQPKASEVSGFLEGEEFTLRAPFSARVDKILVKEGEAVQEGQALADLNSEDLQTDLREAEAVVSLIDAELSRVRSLVNRLPKGGGGGGGEGFYARLKKVYEVGGISRAQLDQAKKASAPSDQRGQAEYLIDQLEARKKDAEAKLRELESFAQSSVLKAPQSGLLSKRYVQEGELVKKGDPCFIVTKVEDVFLKVRLPSRELSRIQVGQNVEVKIEAFPSEKIQGKLIQVEGESENATSELLTEQEKSGRSYKITVKIDNPRGLFKPGMPAKARIRKGEEVIGGESRKFENPTPGT